MKLKLTELTGKITPLPWKTTGSLIFFQKNPGGRKTYIADSSMDPGANQTIANAAYLVHAANVLPKLVEALESDLRIFKALVHDTNPHNDLNRGDSIDYDAACLNVERVEAALTLAREVEI